MIERRIGMLGNSDREAASKELNAMLG